MARAKTFQVFTVRLFMSGRTLFVRAACVENDGDFLNFYLSNGKHVYSIRTDRVVDMASRGMSASAVASLFPNKCNFVECKAAVTPSRAPLIAIEGGTTIA
jgi:hypothetical protein